MALMCSVLEVSRSGYYAWRDRGPSPRTQHRLYVAEKVRTAYQQSRGIYGSPRIYQVLRKERVKCTEKVVAQLMRQEGIRSRRARRFRVRTTDANHPHPVAANTLDRAFAPGPINRRWATDITYVQTDEGWLYVATVMDLGSRRIIGWAAAHHLRAELAIAALSQALATRGRQADLLHHSDRGVQYACEDYRALLERHGIGCSMSRSGDCYDNAVMESFFKTFKVECVYPEHYQTRKEARTSIGQYIELFYNRQRLHSTLGYKSPLEYEAGLA